MPLQVSPGPRGPIRLLLVTPPPRSDEDRLRAAGAEVSAFDSGVSALAHWDAAVGTPGNRFDAAVIDELPEGLSGQALTLALRAGGFAGAVVGLCDDPNSAAAGRWRERGCDLILPRHGLGSAALAWLAATHARAAESGGIA